MQHELIIIKGHLYDKIEPILNYIFDEARNDLTMKLAYSKFVTDESAEEAFLSAVRSIESKLQSYYVEWVRYIATELIHNQVIDEHSSYSEEITKILRSEMIYGMQTSNVHFSYTQMAQIKEIVPHWEIHAVLSRNPQKRINSIKSILDDFKSDCRMAIRRRMDNLFDKIQNTCSNL